MAKQAAEFYHVTGTEVIIIFQYSRLHHLHLCIKGYNLFFFISSSEKSQVDLIPLLSYGLCVPVCLLAVFIVERKGLRTGSIEHH